MIPSIPILTGTEARAWESKVLSGDTEREWAAMNHAGQGLGRAILQDFAELQNSIETLHLLVLAGKGHNAGDAFIAAQAIHHIHPATRATVMLTTTVDSLKPLTQRALGGLKKSLKGQLNLAYLQPPESTSQPTVTTVQQQLSELSGPQGFDISIDGLLGFSFQPPVREPMATLLQAVNTFSAIRLRAAVDLPSGIGDRSDKEHCFHADFTYAAGIPKAPLFKASNIHAVGRIRYLDLGFFDNASPPQTDSVLLTSQVLDPLRSLRPSLSDKRTFGHLLIIGGSRTMPGALMMSVKAALRSGVGLVTALAPKAVAAAFAAAAPEAMWIPWTETAKGGLALKDKALLQPLLPKVSALLMGPGMGNEPETQQLMAEIVPETSLPLVLDADALQPEILAARQLPSAGPLVLTPHHGEFCRIARCKANDVPSPALREFCQSNDTITVLKGPITRIGATGHPLFHSTFGGPVLARGGSGDLLSGLIAGQLAQSTHNPLEAVCRAVAWHGLAADILARRRGTLAVTATELLHYLPDALH